MTFAFVAKLGLLTRPTNISTKKIDGFFLTTYSIVVVGFLLQDSQKKV